MNVSFIIHSLHRVTHMGERSVLTMFYLIVYLQYLMKFGIKALH
jgi:hypothetical protein